MARSKLQIHIHDNSDDALCVSSNGDMISGEISIHMEKNNHSSDLVIMLEGTTTVSLQHEVGVKLQSTQTFLRLSQKTRVDSPATFPFTFVIPSALPTESCSHVVCDPLVRYAHTALPPSLGGKTPCATKNNKTDILTPNAVQIRYCIKATLQACQQDQEPVLSTIREIYIIPTLSSERPPPAFTPAINNSDKPSQLALENHDSPMKAQIVRNIFRRKEGRLVGEILHAGSLTMHLHRQRLTEATIPLRLGYYSASGICPRLHRLTISIRALTIFGLSPSPDISYQTQSHQSSVYTKTLQIATQDMSSITWEAVPCPTIMDPQIEMTYEALVPVSFSLSPDRPFVPTFHSCMVGRSYELEFRVYYQVGRESIFPRRFSITVPLIITMSNR
ncbi:hypothetical protein BO83DRAFT_454631 [Aspergillus eucalypticola CBS 122712]|uniref:Arrestin-like N-terminal domain-containing protein n=1 Tax=Aspergillus eucalypticola (strain CBS 122712 / IBT 29274) TaxID=1448314 RepID=A0A317WBG5_ASPEC|nr:uncharacterized protein BO83DRAFT_454631 [Aspergillus eucalypticola CBS 122712]PWY82677.1 hypothetical protein BO83DRAFT_454631 [Aspergillus eucalypticola CBS 122712]